VTDANRYDTRHLAAVGEDVIVHADVEIKRPELVRLGNHVAIDKGFYCTTAADIGDYVHIGPYVSVIGGGDARFTMKVFAGLSAGVRIVCAGEAYADQGLIGPTIPAAHRDEIINAPVTIGECATVGTNAVLLPGATVAQGVIVIAGSVVTRPTQPWRVYGGSPSRVVRVRDRERVLAQARALGYDFAVAEDPPDDGNRS
jgi:acetyltransferase-like isoleucine patch superfamily enzyme